MEHNLGYENSVRVAGFAPGEDTEVILPPCDEVGPEPADIQPVVVGSNVLRTFDVFFFDNLLLLFVFPGHYKRYNATLISGEDGQRIDATEQERKASLEGVVDRGDLRHLPDGKRVPVRFRATGFDHALLEVADGAVESGVPTAIVLPVADTRTPVLLAAAMLISHLARTQRPTAHVALVSKQIGLRRFYDSLHLRRDCHLAEFFPRTVVDPTGLAMDYSNLAPEVLKKRGRLHFVPGVERLEELKLKRSPSQVVPDGLVIESQACDEKSLCRLLARKVAGDVPVVYLTVDPFDPALDLFRESGAVRAWDAGHMASFAGKELDGDAICTGVEAVAGAADTSFHVQDSGNGDETDVALGRLWDDLMEVQRSPDGPVFSSLSWAWGAFAALSQMIVPLEDYDLHARIAWNTATIADLPEKAGAFARNAVNEHDRELWEVLADDLDAAIEAVNSGNSKPERVASWVHDRIEESKDGVVVVRNRAVEKAVGAYLDAHREVPWGWRKSISTAPLSDLMAGRKTLGTETALFPGPLPSRYGWLFALPPAEQVTVLTHGPWETARAVRQIRSVARELERLARGDVREQATKRLFGRDAVFPEETPNTAPLVKHSSVQANRVPVTVRDAVWSPFDLTIARTLSAADVESPLTTRISPASPDGDEGTVEALLIEFEDGEGYFEPNCPVSRLSGEKLKEVAAKSLKPGDRVMLIEYGARRDLFMHIAKKLEDLPGFIATVELIEMWHERASLAGLRCELDYEQILARMSGTKITNPATVAAWIRGIRHGPNDPEDIKRFGDATGDEILTGQWQRMGQAIKTIRGHRIGLGRWLNRRLAGMSNSDIDNDGYFDRRLGIHYSDLMEAVTIHRVRGVSDNITVVAQLRANRLFESGENLLKGG